MLPSVIGGPGGCLGFEAISLIKFSLWSPTGEIKAQGFGSKVKILARQVWQQTISSQHLEW